ncbi:MAG: hypothetical protein U5L72_17840 [Bacteroidales bacterium]|nr:hypothetical protein [Bacteroidales bacterium]
MKGFKLIRPILAPAPNITLSPASAPAAAPASTFAHSLNINITLLLAFYLTLALPVAAQKDQEAVRVLEEFSRKATAAPSVKIDFTVDAHDTREDHITTVSGSAVISGDSYRVTTDDNIVWADGKAVWNLPSTRCKRGDEHTDPDPAEGSSRPKPSLLFTLYEEGYKVRLLEAECQGVGHRPLPGRLECQPGTYQDEDRQDAVRPQVGGVPDQGRYDGHANGR